MEQKPFESVKQKIIDVAQVSLAYYKKDTSLIDLAIIIRNKGKRKLRK